MNKLNSVNSYVFVFVFGPTSCSYFDPSSQKCDKVVEVGLWLPIAQARICNNVDPLWCLLRQFTSRGKISTEWKFIWEFQDLTEFFTTPPAQYELLFDSGRFWDTLILINQKNLPRHPTFKLGKRYFQFERLGKLQSNHIKILVPTLEEPDSHLIQGT